MFADPAVVKSALEDLCEKCRKGHHPHPRQKHPLEVTIVGLLGTMSIYPKVQMWCLNALKFVGSSEKSIPPVLQRLESSEKSIQILASGTACIYMLSPENAHQIIKSKTPVSRKIEYLAAAQVIPPKDIPFKPPTIVIDNDPVDIIKTALLLEGLGKAIPNLFHPRLENIELLRALMNHDDSIVAQYSYWALVENEQYGFKDISVKIPDIFSLPDNVRVWVYRLIANACADTKIARDLLIECVNDNLDKARESVSKGLLEVYHPQISELIINRLFEEKEEYIKDNLIFHMARFSERDKKYEGIILSEFPNFKKNMKDAILELVKQTPIYVELRKLEADNGNNLFFNGDYILGNKVDLSGAHISGNNISIAGNDSKIEQSIHMIPAESIEEVDGYIQEVEAVIEALPVENDAETIKKLENSKADIKKYRLLPSKENLNKVIENIKWIDETYKSVKDMEIVKQVAPLGK
ncbi:MAG: hypothetical protein JKY46_04495 [Robiginitomaculum sp.]|nr:hypothetical protein [Robiginitomaculum sp.]